MVRALVEAGHRVVVLDDLSAGVRSAVDARAVFSEGCISDVPRVRGLIGEHKCDMVFHFAGLIRVDESMTDPAKYFRANVAATLAFLDAIMDAGLMRMVFSSTAAVYGNPLEIPITEQHPVAPINPYGESKAMIERVLATYAKQLGFSYAALRYFNAAGAHPSGELGENHHPETHLIPRLLDALLEPNPTATVFGHDYGTPDGTCVRDYIHVMDLVDAHLAAAHKLLDGPSGQELVLNLGTGEGASVLEVVAQVKALTKRSLSVDMQPRRAGDPPSLVASAELAAQVLGWTAKHRMGRIVTDAARVRLREL